METDFSVPNLFDKSLNDIREALNEGSQVKLEVIDTQITYLDDEQLEGITVLLSVLVMQPVRVDKTAERSVVAIVDHNRGEI